MARISSRRSMRQLSAMNWSRQSTRRATINALLLALELC
jgi:hypothetical protein